ncbi:MAG: RNA-binding protein [Bacteroidales bacterium]|jgi:RNA recognition motif-containing protein|nr:RNA-binding protein [Bacteroidales bacterium]MDR1345710.1 RNA-binding protein [Bacteroidales bacterium]
MNIFVSNLNFNTTDEDLKNAFEEYGNVFSAKVITDKYTGRSRGFGFVEMTDSDGQKAIDALNGVTFDNQIINVAVARPKEERPQRFNKTNDRRNRNHDRY